MDPAQWQASGGWELAEVCENFELIRKLNFPHLDRVNERSRPLDDVFALEAEGLEGSERLEGAKRGGFDRYSVRKLLNQELQSQSPCVAAMGDQDDHRRRRITSHFRMPGMPWVVVATNVFQEGVDLHLLPDGHSPWSHTRGVLNRAAHGSCRPHWWLVTT